VINEKNQADDIKECLKTFADEIHAAVVQLYAVCMFIALNLLVLIPIAAY
jgi:hypothetical protein